MNHDTLSPDRVERNTSNEINLRLEMQCAARIRYFSNHLHQIDDRLRELEQEWDVERVLELNSSVLSLAGMLLGLRRRKWLLLPIAVQSFFLQHAIQGWCPPLPILRRLGVRTQKEIEAERTALKALLDGRSVEFAR